MIRKNKKSAFTLIELSIVLLVLAVLVGSLLIGRNIVDRATTQKAIDDLNYYRRSVNMFYDAYGFYPGNGETSSACGGKFAEFTTLCNTSWAVNSTPGATNTSYPLPNGTPSAMLWMEAAGLAQNVSYNGVPTAISTGDIFEKQTAAKSTVDGNGNVLIRLFGESPTNIVNNYALNGYQTADVTKTEFGATSISAITNDKPFLMFYYNISAGNGNRAALTAKITSDLDVKLDDGKPNTGNVIAIKGPMVTPGISTASNKFCTTDTFIRGTTLASAGIVSTATYITGDDAKNPARGCNIVYGIEN